MFRRIAVAAFATLLVALPGSAQQRVQITPFYGFMYPQGELPAQFVLDRSDGSRALDLFNGKFEEKTALYGATVAFNVWKFLALEATVAKGTDKFVADRMEETDVQVLAYSAGVGIELPKQWRFEPYLLAGIGVKSYDFDIPNTKAENDREFNFGAGVNLEITEHFALNLQARDFVSDFSSKLDGVSNEKQNDLFFAAGITFSFKLNDGKRSAIER
jgi:hypothetical protein